MWYRLINAALGVWLLAAPAVLDYNGAAATNDRVIGPLVASFATVAIWETSRQLRRMNTLFGIWLLLAPIVLGYPGSAFANSLIVGVVVLGVSLLRGKVEKDFGGGWTALWEPSRQYRKQSQLGKRELNRNAG